MTRFRTRRMERADDVTINTIFNTFPTVAQRTLATMRRVWYEGPAGPVLSWIIEAEEEGVWRLIGHHGLCPIRYTMGANDLIIAKTVNTFLLPEYLGKFVYPRFEQRCFAEVQDSIDASFSVAPKATRLRLALGYKADIRMVHLERGLQPAAFLPRILARLAGRYPRSPLPSMARLSSAMPRSRSRLLLEALSPDAAPLSPFFFDFWDAARGDAGLAPRRDIADLQWRFWNDGQKQRTTLTYSWPSGARAYAIVKHSNAFIYDLEDIFLSVPRADLLQQFLDAIFAWSADRGALMLLFWTSEDGQPPELLEVYRRNMSPSLTPRFRDNYMARRMTRHGISRIGEEWPRCNFTIFATPA
jgi:hypothetical protein